ncbi:baculoviral IAP repeat-containing protein 3-like [Mytilus trossulus]|uniref:baculoviral IAP repeat-containing protein 3-like n=1 Tax=Mytilus trossulus TaxID=6551 RepID=UPI00300502A9
MKWYRLRRFRNSKLFPQHYAFTKTFSGDYILGWNYITPDHLVDSILEMSAVEEATPIDNKAANSQSHGHKPCMDCPVENGNQTLRGTEIKLSTSESITAVVEIDKTKKAEDDPEELQKEIEKMKDLYTCKICLDEKVGVTFLPCGHLVTCAQCSPKLRRCPLCRTFIRSTIQTKI